MPQEYGDDRLTFRLCSREAVELDNLGDAFAGLARQFRKHLAENGIDQNDLPSKLFVTDIRSGSIEFEVASAVGLLYVATQAADQIVIWADFYQRIRDSFEYLARRIPRPSHYTRDDAKDYDAFLRV